MNDILNSEKAFLTVKEPLKIPGKEVEWGFFEYSNLSWRRTNTEKFTKNPQRTNRGYSVSLYVRDGGTPRGHISTEEYDPGFLIRPSDPNNTMVQLFYRWLWGVKPNG